MRTRNRRTGMGLSIFPVVWGLGCSTAPSPDNESDVVAVTQQIVPAVPLCNATTDLCSLAITTPSTVNATDVALGGVNFARANDRVVMTSTVGGGLPVLLSIGNPTTGESSRVGADASVGHVWVAGAFSNADRSEILGQLALAATAPEFVPNANATIIGGIARQVADLTTRTLWSFNWPNQSAAKPSLEATPAGVELEPGVNYDNVTVREKQVLKITKAGNYYIRSLTVESGGKLQIANDVVARLAIANSPTLNGSVLLADQANTAAPKFMMGVLASETVAVSGTFQGLLVAPAADVIVTGWGNANAPLAHRGAFWGRSVEFHQGGMLTQGVDPALFINPAESVLEDDASEPNPADPTVKFVPSLGYLDGTSCDHWPKSLKRSEVLTTVLAGISAANSGALSTLDSALTSLGAELLTSIGSPRSLTVASYIGGLSPDGRTARHWVAVDEQAGVGYDLSHQYLCTEQDLLESAAGNPVCKRQRIGLNFGSTSKQVQVLRRVVPRTRSAIGDDFANEETLTVVLVAPKIHLVAPPDGVPENTVQLDVNLVLAAKDVVGVGSAGKSIGLDVKPYTQPIIDGPARLEQEIKADVRPGVVAVFADKLDSISVVSTHVGMRVAQYTPYDGLTAGQYRTVMVSPTANAPTSDVSAYPEYIFPKKWLLEYKCTTNDVGPLTEPTVTAPPKHFCEQWEIQQLTTKCNYTSKGTLKSDFCGKLWCNGTLKTGVNGYQVNFFQTTVKQSVQCFATAHTGLLNRRRVPSPGGWTILAAGPEAKNVDVRAPQGEAVKFNSKPIYQATDSSAPLKQSDVLHAMSAANTFTGPSAYPFWPNPVDFSVPDFNPTRLRCSMTAIPAGSYGGGYPSATMKCGSAVSPLKLFMYETTDRYGVPSGAPSSVLLAMNIDAKTRNTASAQINLSTTTYLLDVRDVYQGPEDTFPQRLVRFDNASVANTGAQIVSGGDYYELLNRWATNAAKVTAVPGVEFEQLRPVVEQMAALTVKSASDLSSSIPINAVQITEAEVQRIRNFAEQSGVMARLASTPAEPLTGDYMQVWRTDITGTPYGKVLTGWRPQWAKNSSPSTLLQVKESWATAKARANEFYELYELKDSSYEYMVLYDAVTKMLATLRTGAESGAADAINAMPNQEQALSILQSTVNDVEETRKTLASDMRAILKLSATATDDEVTNEIGKLVASALSQCSARNSPKDPWASALFSIAEFVPYVSQGAKFLKRINETLDKVDASTKYIKNFNGSIKTVDNLLDITKPVVGFLTPVGEYLGYTGTVSSIAGNVASALGKYEGNCPGTSDTALLAKTTLMTLANEQALVQTMQSQLSTLAGSISAVTGNAQYYRAAISTQSQTASMLAKTDTALKDAQLIDELKEQNEIARRRGLVLACQAAQAAIEARLPTMAQLSRSMETNAGRDTTSPGLAIPAWDDGVGNAFGDARIPIPYNLWNPTHQVVITDSVQTSGSSTVRDSYMTQAWDRWIRSNDMICKVRANAGNKVNLAFHVKKDIVGAERVAAFFTKGWAPFSVEFSDWLAAESIDMNVSPTVLRNSPEAWGAMLSAPVVWNVAFQGCTGTADDDNDGVPDDPCCDRVASKCFMSIQQPANTGVHLVRLSAAWVPTQNENCPESFNDIEPNPDFYPGHPRPSNGVGLFPVATQTCRSLVTVPADYEPVLDNGTKLRTNWYLEQLDEICYGIGTEAWKLTSLRGSPLFGEWALASSSANAEILARYMSDKASPIPPQPEYASNNAKITAIRVVFMAMAEPTATRASPVYRSLAEGPRLEDYN